MSPQLQKAHTWTSNSNIQCTQVKQSGSSMNVVVRGTPSAVAATIPDSWCQSMRKKKEETWSLRTLWFGTLLSMSLLSSSSLQVIGPPSLSGTWTQTKAGQPSGKHLAKATWRYWSRGHQPIPNSCQTQGSNIQRSMTSSRHSILQLIFRQSTLQETAGLAARADSKF